ncbi:MAG: hypothetical protein AAFY05_04945 [Pseudomonadota bacterium]
MHFSRLGLDGRVGNLWLLKSARKGGIALKTYLIMTFFGLSVAASGLALFFGGMGPERIPLNAFQATYYDRSHPDRPVSRKTVNDIAINYGNRGNSTGIDPHSFIAVWKGRLVFDETVSQTISVSQGHSRSYLKINGEIVYFGGKNTEFEHEFEKGEHLVEVGFTNGWHTVDFKVTFQDLSNVLDQAAFNALMRSRKTGQDELVYASLYSSSSKDHSVQVDLSESDKDRILWLDSYEATDWKIDADPGLRAVVVASYTPGSRVLGLNKATPVHFTKDRMETYFRVPKRCTCVYKKFHCYKVEELPEKARRLPGRLKSRTGADIVAIASNYAGKDMKPQTWSNFNASLDKVMERYRNAKAACLG